MTKSVTLSSWQFAGGIILLIAWISGDYLFLSAMDASALDCLPGDGRMARKLEAVVCSPKLIGEGWLGLAALLWMWGPLVALWLWLRRR